MAFLLQACGWEVVHAADGPRGLALAVELKPALILLDIQLPGMDGYAVARALKADPVLAPIPVVAVTSCAMAPDRAAAIAAGCDGYIEKPIDPETFVATTAPSPSKPHRARAAPFTCCCRWLPQPARPARRAVRPNCRPTRTCRHRPPSTCSSSTTTKTMALLAERVLRRAGYRSTTFSDAAQALAAVRADPAAFDAVVTDYNMPGTTGLDVARALAKLAPDLPVFIGSGYVDAALQDAATAAGVRGLLHKERLVEDLVPMLQARSAGLSRFRPARQRSHHSTSSEASVSGMPVRAWRRHSIRMPDCAAWRPGSPSCSSGSITAGTLETAFNSGAPRNMPR